MANKFLDAVKKFLQTDPTWGGPLPFNNRGELIKSMGYGPIDVNGLRSIYSNANLSSSFTKNPYNEADEIIADPLSRVDDDYGLVADMAKALVSGEVDPRWYKSVAIYPKEKRITLRDCYPDGPTDRHCVDNTWEYNPYAPKPFVNTRREDATRHRNGVIIPPNPGKTKKEFVWDGTTFDKYDDNDNYVGTNIEWHRNPRENYDKQSLQWSRQKLNRANRDRLEKNEKTGDTMAMTEAKSKVNENQQKTAIELQKKHRAQKQGLTFALDEKIKKLYDEIKKLESRRGNLDNRLDKARDAQWDKISKNKKYPEAWTTGSGRRSPDDKMVEEYKKKYNKLFNGED